MKKFILSFLFVGTMLSPASAQSTITHDGSARLLNSYRAYIGSDDLYNSKGERLTQPWQIIRQDRANYHAYRRRDRGDQGDNFFSDPANRQRLEAMLASGAITAAAANDIVRGGVWIRVEIYGRGNIGEWVDVHVEE